MPHINMELFKRIPEHLKGVMQYYPDVSLFKLNQIQYTHLWHQLSSSKYLYTNGYEIRPTNWYMHTFQSFKGWLGFDNNCHPEKISYNLSKLAYYGYMKQLAQPTSVTGYAMSPEICALLAKTRSDLTTAQWQIELVKAFFKVEPHLNIEYSYQRLNSNHRFGESWASVGAIELIPQLDPQDDSLIAMVIKTLDKTGCSNFVFLENSKYAKAAAQYYYDKAKNTPVPSFFARLMWVDPRPGYLEQALAYDPEISKKDAQNFIEYHLKKEEYENAFNLLEQLADSKLVLKFLLAIPEIDRKMFIQKDTPIAAIMAKYYLEKKQYTVAQELYSNIEFLSPDAAFAIAIKENRYVPAYKLFKKLESTCAFSMPERKTLATILFNLAETEYDTGKRFRNNKQWEQAETHYLRSLVQKKMAHHLDPTTDNLENLYIHKRLYSQLLIDVDTDLYKPEESEIANIQKAITLLRECHPSKNDEQYYQKAALANGLMRLVDNLREKIAFTYSQGDHVSIAAHLTEYQHEITALIKTLNELITLLEGSQEKEFRAKLGKAHFLLADVQEFFDINAPDINKHYKMAMEAVPDNPFYTLRVSEVFNEEKDKYQPIGVIGLKKMGYITMDYLHWYDERWSKRDQIIYNVKDIHQSSPEPDQQTNLFNWNLGL